MSASCGNGAGEEIRIGDTDVKIPKKDAGIYCPHATGRLLLLLHYRTDLLLELVKLELFQLLREE